MPLAPDLELDGICGVLLDAGSFFFMGNQRFRSQMYMYASMQNNF